MGGVLEPIPAVIGQKAGYTLDRLPDKTLKCSVFRIRGSIPASNFILLPRTSSQSLGFTGRYLYLLFRPGPNKHFVVHLDVAAEGVLPSGLGGVGGGLVLEFTLARPVSYYHYVPQEAIEGQVIRISFSNLFKEFKSTATWLQFPFQCGAAPGSVYESTTKTAKHGLVGPAPVCVRWTCLMMDLRYVLSVYLNKTHSHLKSIKLCANMAIKNIMTSDLLLDPGLSFSEFRQAGMVLPEGTAPMPREMCFPVPKGSSWHQLYDYIRFPSDGVKLPFDSIQKGLNNPKEAVVDESPFREESRSVNISRPVQDRVSLIQQITTPKPRAKQRSLLLTSSLPELTSSHSGDRESPSQRSQAFEEDRVVCDDGEGVHVFAHYKDDDVSTHSTNSEEVAAVWANDGEEVVYPCHAIIVSMKISSGQQRFFIGHTDKVSALALNARSSLLASAQMGTHCLVRLWSYSKGQCLTMIKTHAHSLNTLRCPVNTRQMRIWSDRANEALKDCFETTDWEVLRDPHALGTPDLKALLEEKKRAFRSGNKAEMRREQKELRRKIREGKDQYRKRMEGQLQQNNAIGVWRSLKTISGFKESNRHPAYTPAFSSQHSALCCSAPNQKTSEEGTEEDEGEEGSRKERYRSSFFPTAMVVVWNTQRVDKGGVVTVMAKAHTDVDIQTMKIAFFDDTRMVSCGVGNVRLWRVRGGCLRSCPVNLGQYHNLEFTDLAFEQGHTPDRQLDDRTLFASSKSGHILDIDYVSVAIKNVRRLLPAQQSHSQRREKQTFSTGPGIAVNSVSVCGSFCATGSEDGFLRLWPLDFSSVLLEAEHEGPVCFVTVSLDGLSVLAATSTGNLGYLDVSSRGYRTLMRSHTATVLGFSVDGIRRQITTASRDCTVRVWAMDSTQQLYDFVSDEDDDAPCSVAFHPSLPVFACGSSSGTVRVFDIPTSSLLAQHRQHRGAVVGLVFSPDGEHLYSAGSLGYLALYNASQPEYHVLRVLGNVVARGTDRGPDALAVSSDSCCLAFVGPTEFTVTIMDAHSLDELLRVDVSVLDVESTTLDTALKVCFSPSSLSHLLITTSANKILWINRNTGRLLREVSEVHKHQCASLAVSEDGRYLLTAGHNAVKVWDYHMKLDVNSQVFIGHSEPITQVSFTPDQMGVVSVGDAIFFWDFLAHLQEVPACSLSSSALVSSPPRAGKTVPTEQAKVEFNRMSSNGVPRKAAPRPSSSLPILDVSSIDKIGPGDSSHLSLGGGGDDDDNNDDEELQPVPAHSLASRHASFLRVTERAAAGSSVDSLANQIRVEENGEDLKPVRPDCYKHFTPRYKMSVLDTSAATPPPGQEGLSLKAVVGYNGNGRSNMIWNPDTGLFVYSCGCVVVAENLHSGSQRHWLGHSEEISTLAVTHDAQIVASASGGGALSKSLICIWNIQDGSRRNSVSYHKGSVQSLAFSRDDLYFLSVGDFEESVVALWSTRSFELLCAVSVSVPLHEAAFCPSSADQLTFTGSNAVFFCYIRTRGRGAELEVQKVAVPERIGEAEVSCLCYNTNSVLFTGTNGGLVCVWDCNTHCCFMTWEADEGEIGVLLCRGNKLVTGSNSKKLRLWSVAAVQSLRSSNSNATVQHDRDAQVFLEQEMLLDGTVVSVAFDDVMDMGIVGTTAGTLWYINWADNTSIRLISGHKSKVNGVVCSPDERHFVTCGLDGSVRVWALPSNELLVQFQVLNQSCECVCWSRPVDEREPGAGVCVAGGYSDGSVRIFSVESAEMELKLQPHHSSVCVLQYSHHGQVLLSGGRDGVLTVSSPFTGITLRIISDHKGVPITTIQCTSKQYKEFGLEGNELWLAVSADRRVSIWAADWAKDKCELLDWLTFPAPSSPKDTANLPPSLAAFSPTERGVLVYTGYAAEKELTFYCLKKKRVLRTVSLTDWALSLSLCSKGRLLATGSNQRVLKLIDSSSGRFQDFTWHSDAVHLCSFSPSGTQLFTTAHNNNKLVLEWEMSHGRCYCKFDTTKTGTSLQENIGPKTQYERHSERFVTFNMAELKLACRGDEVYTLSFERRRWDRRPIYVSQNTTSSSRRFLSKVDQLDLQGVLVDQQVLRFDVPVQDTSLAALERRHHRLPHYISCHVFSDITSIVLKDTVQALAWVRALQDQDVAVRLIKPLEELDDGFADGWLAHDLEQSHLHRHNLKLNRLQDNMWTSDVLSVTLGPKKKNLAFINISELPGHDITSSLFEDMFGFVLDHSYLSAQFGNHGENTASSAFHTVIPYKLSEKLCTLRLTPTLCNWVLNFLTDRPQSVTVGSRTSNTRTVSTGVPQGCVLCPLLYMLFTYDCMANTGIIKSATESVLTSSITVWYGNCTAQERKALQLGIKTVQSISGAASLQDHQILYQTRVIRRAHNIIRDIGKRKRSEEGCSQTVLQGTNNYPAKKGLVTVLEVSNTEAPARKKRKGAAEQPKRQTRRQRKAAKPDTFATRYTVGEKLGQGSFRSVFKGQRVSDGLQVAIKFVQKLHEDRYVESPVEFKVMPVEVALLQIMSQPPICKTDYGGYVTEDMARDIMWQSVMAAFQCSKRGVLHRDIKLENLLINQDTLEVKLIDFGCSNLVKKYGYNSFEGTDEYCPPEFLLEERKRVARLARQGALSVGSSSTERSVSPWTGNGSEGEEERGLNF
ncbi:hypothetical protein SRHO_G00058200 [Serrasalmus rhombeus]